MSTVIASAGGSQRGRQARGSTGASPSGWFVYLVECCDGTYYTGVARDVHRRLAEHNAGRGARYTRGRAPVKIVVASRAMEKRAAYRLEWAVKQLPRRRKVAALRKKKP